MVVRVAVGRETRMDFSVCIRKDGERSGMRKANSVGAEEFLDSIAFVSDRFGLGVGRLNGNESCLGRKPG